MKYNKQTMIDGLKRSIEKMEKEIEEYSKPCDRRVGQGRTAHREFLKKKLKKMKAQLKELEDDKQELIDVPRILFPVGTEVLIKGKIVGLKALDDRFVESVVKLAYGEQIIAPNDAIYVKDEPEAGHADEAPRYVKNVLARLRELPLHDREVWLKAIMSEFEQDFSHAKWREGYEQGKFEGMVGREKVTVPQFVADFITEQKKLGYTLSYSIDASMSDRVAEWYWDNSEVFALAWILGYEVEKEKKFFVKIKCLSEE